jgi:hypothetical protein
MARLNICTSSASSAHPLKQAQKVLRSLAVTCRYHENIVSSSKLKARNYGVPAPRQAVPEHGENRWWREAD